MIYRFLGALTERKRHIFFWNSMSKITGKSHKGKRGTAANNQPQPAGSPRGEPGQGRQAYPLDQAEEPPVCLNSAPLETYADHVTRNSRAQSELTSDAAPITSDTGLNSAIRKVIENLLKDDVFVNELVHSIQDKLLHKMKESICQEVTESVKFDIDEQNDEMTSMRKEIRDLQDANDEAEQYSRRTCLIFSGLPETPEENTDTTIIQFCRNDLGVDIREEDIDRSHRLGKPSSLNQANGVTTRGSSAKNASRSTPRNLIVKFASYRKRESVYSARFNLKNVNNIVYINESLTKKRKDLFWKIRGKYRKIISKIWTQDGRIFIKLLNDMGRVIVSSENDLSKLDRYT